MNQINTLFNQLFDTNNVNYVKGKTNLAECSSKFMELTKEDNLAFVINYYLFPPDNCYEKNIDEFWFLKYDNSEIFDECDFAIELLNLLLKNKYKNNTNQINIEPDFNNIIKKFYNYRLIGDFFSAIKNYGEILFSITAYLVRDAKYFEDFLGIYVLSGGIQTAQFIHDVKKKIAKNLNNMDNLNTNNTEIINKLIVKINTLESKLENAIKENKDLKKRIEKLEINNTFELCLKYLYKVLVSRFQNVKQTNDIWEQIEKINDILSRPEYHGYKFLTKFTKEMVEGKIPLFNLKENDYIINIEEIEEILNNNKMEDLSQVVNFFKSLPKIKEFIKISLTYYSNPNKADEEFQKIIAYNKAYTEIFGESKYENNY